MEFRNGGRGKLFVGKAGIFLWEFGNILCRKFQFFGKGPGFIEQRRN